MRDLLWALVLAGVLVISVSSEMGMALVFIVLVVALAYSDPELGRGRRGR